MISISECINDINDINDIQLLSLHKVVRDLYWSVTSPHIISALNFPVFPHSFGDKISSDFFKWLQKLHDNPNHLIEFVHRSSIGNKALPLGLYFATLLEYFLRYSPLFHPTKFQVGTQIVSSNGQTLGQLKFLFRMHTTELEVEFQDIHVESSVKYFLLYPEILPKGSTIASLGHVPLERFIGPHLGENLAWRVQEVERKLLMSQGQSVQLWLSENYSNTIKSYIVLRGYLFYPLMLLQHTTDLQGNFEINTAIAKDHSRGWWTTDIEEELTKKVLDTQNSRFLILPKLHWLAPVVAKQEISDGNTVVHLQDDKDLNIETVFSMTLEELVVYVKTHFNSYDKDKCDIVMPLMIAEVRQSDKSVNIWTEVSRGFIIDSKSWDPSPLCQDAVRYRRPTINNSGNKVNSKKIELTVGGGSTATLREYEARSKVLPIVADGIVKLSDEELLRLREEQLDVFCCRSFIDSPILLCHEVILLLTSKKKKYSHTDMVEALQRFYSEVTDVEKLSWFIVSCLKYIVCDTGDIDYKKQQQRLGHILLDALEHFSTKNTNKNRHDIMEELATDANIRLEIFSNLHDFRDLMLSALARQSGWTRLHLIIRAFDVIALLLRTSNNDLMQDSLCTGIFQHIVSGIQKLSATQSTRWNAIAVELCRCFCFSNHINLISEVQELFQGLLQVEDLKNCERLVQISYKFDRSLLAGEFITMMLPHLSKNNLTRLLKRLQPYQGVTTLQLQPFNNEVYFEINHEKNRDLRLHYDGRSVVDIPEYTLVDTFSSLDALKAYIISIQNNLEKNRWEGNQQFQHVIGLDCEWRPSHLPNTSDKTDEIGVSLYQLSINHCIFLVDVKKLGSIASEPLKLLIEYPSFTIVGFCLQGDLKRLGESFPMLEKSFQLKSAREMLFIELKDLAKRRGIDCKSQGLANLYKICLKPNEKLNKQEQTSDWSNRPLSEQQLVYAAKDALIVRDLAIHLLIDAPMLLPPRGVEHVKSTLQSLGILHQVTFHCLKSNEEKKSLGLIVKTIALVSDKRQYVAVVLALHRTINIQKLNAIYRSVFELADSTTLVQVFGYSPGCLGPIGLRYQGIDVVVDSNLFDINYGGPNQYILCGGGKENVVYAILPNTLIDKTHAKVFDVTI